MNTRLSTLVAGVSIASLLAWLGLTAAGSEGGVTVPPASAPAILLQERGGGSEVPCDVPLAWRLARVDPQFGIDVEEATRSLEEAARLWELGTGRELFEHDPADGFPVRLVYDDRQARLVERIRRTGELDSIRTALDARRLAVEERATAFAEAAKGYAARIADLDRRVGEHNEAVRAWNERDDQDEEVWRALEAAGSELERERQELLGERPALDREEEAVRAAEQELNRRIDEHQQRAGDLDTALPPEEVEAGIYREAVSRQGSEVVEVSREIRLYRFANGDELRLLAAHEMGHALGLGHTDETGAVMSASARSDEPVTALTDVDVALFAGVCQRDATDR